MPIRPELKPLYPPNWSELSRQVRFERAGGALWLLGDSLRDFHEFNEFYGKPVDEENFWGTVRACANDRVIGCVDNTRNLFEVISKADLLLTDRLTYLTGEVEEAETICLKQIEKQILDHKKEEDHDRQSDAI